MGILTSLPGLPVEFVSASSKVADEVLISPAADRAAPPSSPAPLQVSIEVGSNETAVLAVRRASGALTFHQASEGGGEGTAARQQPFDVSPSRAPGRSGGLITEAIKATVIKSRKTTGDGLSIGELAAQLETSIWKKRNLAEGWHLVEPSRLANRHLVLGSPVNPARSLLFLHGSFSITAATFAPLVQSGFFDRVRDLYGGRIFGFDHFSISRSIEENARMLLESLPGGPTTFDVVAHGRGGLILRTIVENRSHFGLLGERFALGRTVLVACPNDGTPIATPALSEVGIGWLANLLEIFPDNPFMSGSEFVANAIIWLSRRVSGSLPGMSGLDPKSPFNLWDQEHDDAGTRFGYSALVANYHPASLLPRLMDAGIDSLFPAANDLFGSTESGWRMGHDAVIPAERIGCFGPGGNLPGDNVDYINIFSQPATTDFLVNALAGRGQSLPQIDPYKLLPVRRLLRSDRETLTAASAPGLDMPAVTRDRIAGLKGRARELAEAVSIASRVEPELLRAARLRLVPNATVSDEADVWFSSVMASRGPLYGVMDEHALQTLRATLARDRPRLHAGWQVLSELHQNAPAALRAEEELTFRTLADPDDPKIASLLESINMALQQGRVGLARWAARALPRLPAAVRQLPEAWEVSIRAGGLLGRPSILDGAGPRDGMDAMASRMTAADLPTTPVGLRLLPSALQISAPPEPGATTIDVPDTDPILLEVSWADGDREQRRLVSLPLKTVQRVESIGTGPLRVVTAALDEFAVQPLTTAAAKPLPMLSKIVGDGITVASERGDGIVLLAFDLDRHRLERFAGFRVGRTSGGDRTELLNRVTQAGAKAPLPTGVAPLQTFHCLDSPQARSTTFMYDVTAMYFGSATALTEGSTVSVTVDLRKRENEPVEVGFLRPTTSTWDSPTLDSGTLGRGREMLRRFLDEAIADKDSTLHVLAADLDDEAVVKRLAAMGSRLSIVLGQTRADKKLREAAIRRLAAAGCHVSDAAVSHASHRHCLVRLRHGRPADVLTGSLTFSSASLADRYHHVIVLHDAHAASLYEKHFEMWQGRSAITQSTWSTLRPGEVQVEVLFTPAANPYSAIVAAITRARSNLVFLLDHYSSKSIEDKLRATWKSGRRFVVGSFRGLGKDSAVWNGTEIQVPPHRSSDEGEVPTSSASPDGQNVVVDFNTADAMVFAGSAGFSDGERSFGGSIVAIHDPRIATAFAVETLAQIDNGVFREFSQHAAFKLKLNDEWARRFYQRNSQHALRRTMLARTQDPATEEPPASPRKRRTVTRKRSVRMR